MPNAQRIVERIGGATDPEMHFSGVDPAWVHYPDAEGIDDAAPAGATSAFIADKDAPELVSFATEHSDPGDQLLERYIRIHSSNPYTEYRNRSLWGILGAAACHPDQSQARRLAMILAEAALAPAAVAFREGMRVTMEALRARAGDADALERFEARVAEAVRSAASLHPTRSQADSWGNHSRRLSMLAEAEALALGRNDRAARLLAQARALPFGFAGYRSSACLTLAEAHLACTGGDVSAGIPDVHDARQAAHNIQEPAFCALRTARVNAMVTRWWRAPVADLATVIACFVSDPLTKEFAPVHVVSETYGERNSGPQMIPLPDPVRQATTLREIANDVYQLPVSAMSTLQPEIDPDESLPPGTHLAVPERAFGPLLAARFSAEAMVSSALTHEEWSVSIRRLVPIAADAPTVMHTVLTRLLLVVQPDDAHVLDAIDKIAPLDWMQEPAASEASEFGPS